MNKKLLRRYWKSRRVGFSLLSIAVLILIWMLPSAAITLPHLASVLPELFLPPHCDKDLFTQITDEPPSQMRVIKDLYRNTQVIAVDDSGNEVCFFKASTHPTSGFWPAQSPDGQHLAFISTQIISDYRFLDHIFIVDVESSSYIRFSPEGVGEVVQDLAWSMDSTELAYTSFSPCCGNPHISLVTLDGKLNWSIDLGEENIYQWGHLQWSEDGRDIRYGHDEDSVLGITVGLPFWCAINRDGSNLQCEKM